MNQLLKITKTLDKKHPNLLNQQKNGRFVQATILHQFLFGEFIFQIELEYHHS